MRAGLASGHIRRSLRVDLNHHYVTFTKAMTADLDQEIKDQAHWLGLEHRDSTR